MCNLVLTLPIPAEDVKNGTSQQQYRYKQQMLSACLRSPGHAVQPQHRSSAAAHRLFQDVALSLLAEPTVCTEARYSSRKHLAAGAAERSHHSIPSRLRCGRRWNHQAGGMAIWGRLSAGTNLSSDSQKQENSSGKATDTVDIQDAVTGSASCTVSCYSFMQAPHHQPGLPSVSQWVLAACAQLTAGAPGAYMRAKWKAFQLNWLKRLYGRHNSCQLRCRSPVARNCSKQRQQQADSFMAQSDCADSIPVHKKYMMPVATFKVAASLVCCQGHNN